MNLSSWIIRVIDLFYFPPVSSILPRQVFRYAVCGGANVLFGWGCYFLIYNYLIDKQLLDLGLVVLSPHVAAMLLTFPIAFFLGFWLNRQVAFRRSPVPHGVQLLRYALSVAGSVVVNYLCLKFFVEVCAIWATPSQMLASCITTVYSFLAAKYFTFRHAAAE